MNETVLTADAILFDMDGTLVDSTKVVEGTWRRFAARHDIDPQRVLGVSHGRTTASVVSMFATGGMNIQTETAIIQAEELDDLDGVVEVPGAAALLSGLEPGRWAVVTSADSALCQRRMTKAGLPLPGVLVAAEDVAVGKPDPQGYLSAAKTLGVDPAATVIFEDAEPGLRAARAAGATTVVVGGYAGPAAEGLHRVADLHAVDIRPSDGALRLTLRGPSAGKGSP